MSFQIDSCNKGPISLAIKPYAPSRSDACARFAVDAPVANCVGDWPGLLRDTTADGSTQVIEILAALRAADRTYSISLQTSRERCQLRNSGVLIDRGTY